MISLRALNHVDFYGTAILSGLEGRRGRDLALLLPLDAGILRGRPCLLRVYGYFANAFMTLISVH